MEIVQRRDSRDLDPGQSWPRLSYLLREMNPLRQSQKARRGESGEDRYVSSVERGGELPKTACGASASSEETVRIAQIGGCGHR